MFYEPKDGHGLPHNPFKAIVAPRPIGWISTLSAKGFVNLAPFSFFNAFSGEPPMVAFTTEGPKDSGNNASETGEFVVNLATRAMVEKLNLTSAALAEDVNEFEYAGIESEPSQMVAPPRVKHVPAALECKVTMTTDLTDIDGNDVQRKMVIGQVVGIYIDDEYLTDGLFDVIKAGTIARLGYHDYCQVTELFQLVRPKV